VYYLLPSDGRCYPGWTGNRCHVKEKPSLSTASPKPDDTQLGGKETPPHSLKLSNLYLFTVSLQSLLLSLQPIEGSPVQDLNVLPSCLDAVYVGIAIGLLLLLVVGVAVCTLALYKEKCYLV